MSKNGYGSHKDISAPTPLEAKDTIASGAYSRAGRLQEFVVRLRPIRVLPTWSRYTLTALIVFACFAMRYFLEGIYPYPFLLFLPSVIVASFIFDRGTGFFASFLSAILAFYFFMGPGYSFAPEDFGEVLALAVFLLIGLFTASAIEALRVTVDELGIRNKELRNAETRYRTILETAVDAIIVMDDAGIVQSFNPAAERIFGYKSAEVVGRNVKMLMPLSEARAHDGYIEAYLKTGIKKIIGVGREVTGMKKDGLLLPLELSIAEWADASGKRFFTGIMRDISARKQDEIVLRNAQQELNRTNKRLRSLVDEKSEQVTSVEKKLSQAQKLEAVGSAVAILAHDFRNILSPILGAVDIIKTVLPPDNQKIASLLEMVARTGNDGKTMIDNVLAFVHKTSPQPQRFNVNDLLRDHEQALRQTIKEGISLQFMLDQNLPDVFADISMLQRAISNMAVNAQDAMPRGGVILFETATQELPGEEGEGSENAKAGSYVRITVRDTGSGMAPEVLEKIFEPFYTTKPMGQGTGLGLSMVMDFVRLSGGRMTVDSSLGAGTSINVFLPAV